MKTPVSATTLEQFVSAQDSTPARFPPVHVAANLHRHDALKVWRSSSDWSARFGPLVGVAAPRTSEETRRKRQGGARFGIYSPEEALPAPTPLENPEHTATARYVVPARTIVHGHKDWYSYDEAQSVGETVLDISVPRPNPITTEAWRSIEAEKDKITTSLIHDFSPDSLRQKPFDGVYAYAWAQIVINRFDAEATYGPLSTLDDRDDAETPSKFDRYLFSSQLIKYLPQWTILDATTHEEIIVALQRSGLNEIAERITYLEKLQADDPDEPAMTLDSLRELAQFLVTERKLPKPKISVSPDGLAHAQWRLRSRGLVAMQFKPSGDIRFSAISRPWQAGIRREAVHGTRPRKKALEVLHDFMLQISDD